MSLPFTIVNPKHGTVTPLVIGSPHSGRQYPADFGYSCPSPVLRQTEDAFVDELVADAAVYGATIIQAEFPRSYIDVNRADNDIDPAVLAEAWPVKLQPSMRTLQGLGLVRRLCKSGVPMYDKPLTAAVITHRLKEYYYPYHVALEQIMAQRAALFGEVWLLDCHSMPSRDGRNVSRRQPDFVLGDRDGASCDPAFTRKVQDALQEMGYSVVLNNPYKGVEIMRRYGRPEQGRQALQIEINRDLYINEQTLKKHDGFAKLKLNLSALFEIITAEISMVPERLAAE